MTERPYVPSDRWMTDEEAARLSEWSSRSRRYDRLKGIAALLVGIVIVGLAALGPHKPTQPRPDIDKTPEELLAEIRQSGDEYAVAIQRLRISLASQTQLENLAALQSRYDRLSALTAGQEEIARAYRAILMERTWKDRLIDFLFGVFASISAAIVWDRATRRRAAAS